MSTAQNNTGQPLSLFISIMLHGYEDRMLPAFTSISAEISHVQRDPPSWTDSYRYTIWTNHMWLFNANGKGY